MGLPRGGRGDPLMRLAFCNATRRWGGVKTWTVDFAAALRDMGHELFLYGRAGAFIERARARGLRARPVRFGMDFNPVSTAWFCREFRAQGVEAVLVNVGKDLRTAGVAARLCGLPLVQRIGLPGDMDGSFKERLLHAFLRPHYLCPCAFIRDGLLESLPFIDRADTSVVYSAKTPRASAPHSPGRPLRLVSSSQVNANKGHAELARTLAVLKREGFNFHWEVAGTGDSLEALRALCGELGLTDRVTFHGFLQDLPSLLAACDVFVLSSYVEGLPNTLLEALAQGLAPVARDVGGVGECWPESLPELLVPFAGPERYTDWSAVPPAELPRRLPLYAPLRTVLAASPDQVLRWKTAAWEHCARNFSLQTQAVRLETFFQERIAGPER